MKKIIAFFVLLNLVFAANKNLKNMDLITLFKGQYYSYICKNRWKYINKYNNKREDLLSIVAYACLKKRFLTPAFDLAKVLTVTKEGRANATYITTLFLMKKLLIQILNGDLTIGNLNLPIIKDNTLGIVFYQIEHNNYKLQDKKIFTNFNNKKFITYISDDNNIVIETYDKNNNLIKKEFYW